MICAERESGAGVPLGAAQWMLLLLGIWLLWPKTGERFSTALLDGRSAEPAVITPLAHAPGDANSASERVRRPYFYSAFGQLLTATPEPQTTPTATFVYDPLGRLCQRTINGLVTNLYYAGDKLVEERDGNGNKICIYLYGAGGERVCRLDVNDVGTFYHYDARGFTTHLSDLSANVNEQYLYDAWGQPFVYDATGTQSRGEASQIVNNRFLRAQGYEWYPELGLYRCGARFYDPSNGHFLQTDPIAKRVVSTSTATAAMTRSTRRIQAVWTKTAASTRTILTEVCRQLLALLMMEPIQA